MVSRTALVVLSLAIGSTAAQAADFNGKWTAEFATAAGTLDYTWEFHVDGAKVTGKEFGPNWSLDIIDAKVEGDTLSFAQMYGNTRVECKAQMDSNFIRFNCTPGAGLPTEFVAFHPD